MSRINKVNPGQYTQAGRLTPDDRAREMKKQREAGSPKKTEGGQFGLPAALSAVASAKVEAGAKAGECTKARVTKEDKSEDEENMD